MFKIFYSNNDPITAKGLMQKHGDRYLIHNPPQMFLSTKELDQVYDLEFERDVHPFYRRDGKVKALETIRFSITTHRGCYGECNFCAIAIHKGRTVIPRSEESILREVDEITKKPDFKGIIYDVGGPTANMYGIECKKKMTEGSCKERRCLYPSKKKLLRFRELFTRINKELGKKQFLTYYFIAAHPGCDAEDMNKLKNFVIRQLRLRPEQVQIFTPTPSTYSTLMYWTGIDPFSGKEIFVEKDIKKKEKQKRILKQTP